MVTHGDMCSEACYRFGMLISRRGLITGLASLVAAPAIVRASSLMPVKAIPDEWVFAAHERGINGLIPYYTQDYIRAFEELTPALRAKGWVAHRHFYEV
jgi:hypothetical protein